MAKIDFTPASAFHFFTNGVKQYFFENDKSAFGLVINRTEANRNVMFRDSMRCEVSDSIFKSPLTKQQFEEQLRDNSFIRTTERDVSRIVKTKWEKLSEDQKKYRKDCAEDGLSDPGDVSLPWTEGIFRHKFSDIDGILIQNNKTSVRNGYAFAKVVEEVNDKRTEFYMWSDAKSDLIKIDRQKIRDFLGFEAKESGGQRILIDDETQAKIDEYKTCFTQVLEGGR